MVRLTLCASCLPVQPLMSVMTDVVLERIFGASLRAANHFTDSALREPMALARLMDCVLTHVMLLSDLTVKSPPLRHEGAINRG
jgi:hypothetical protein